MKNKKDKRDGKKKKIQNDIFFKKSYEPKIGILNHLFGCENIYLYIYRYFYIYLIIFLNLDVLLLPPVTHTPTTSQIFQPTTKQKVKQKIKTKNGINNNNNK